MEPLMRIVACRPQPAVQIVQVSLMMAPPWLPLLFVPLSVRSVRFWFFVPGARALFIQLRASKAREAQLRYDDLLGEIDAPASLQQIVPGFMRVQLDESTGHVCLSPPLAPLLSCTMMAVASRHVSSSRGTRLSESSLFCFWFLAGMFSHKILLDD